MKRKIKRAFEIIAEKRAAAGRSKKAKRLYRKYKDYTMIIPAQYQDNLLLSARASELNGDVVECGVWRGGMIAGMAEMIGGNRNYFLFDSFEGLPEAKEIDGAAAKRWQADTKSPWYYDNCKAEIDVAIKAMEQSGVKYECVKGWFENTIPSFDKTNKIALLRLDADWYESTMVCLQKFFPLVIENGLILIDDYYTWSGCSRAVHDYLSAVKSACRIYTSTAGVAYMIKRSD